jgi:hypothetical protein
MPSLYVMSDLYISLMNALVKCDHFYIYISVWPAYVGNACLVWLINALSECDRYTIYIGNESIAYVRNECPT